VGGRLEGGGREVGGRCTIQEDLLLGRLVLLGVDEGATDLSRVLRVLTVRLPKDLLKLCFRVVLEKKKAVKEGKGKQQEEEGEGEQSKR